MTYDLSDAQRATRDAARAFGRHRLATEAQSIDASGVIPSDVLRDARAVVASAGGDVIAQVVAIEELASASAGVAAAAAFEEKPGGSAADMSGLRGFGASPPATDRGRLIVAAIALGIARAAVDAAVSVLRQSARAAQDQEKPHWVIADAATEWEAARLLTLQAATLDPGDAGTAGQTAIAKLAATRAAEQAVDAALDVVGPTGFSRGAVLERLARDARTVSLLLGTEEELRALAAQAVLPG